MRGSDPLRETSDTLHKEENKKRFVGTNTDMEVQKDFCLDL